MLNNYQIHFPSPAKYLVEIDNSKVFEFGQEIPKRQAVLNALSEFKGYTGSHEVIVYTIDDAGNSISRVKYCTSCFSEPLHFDNPSILCYKCEEKKNKRGHI